MDAQTQDAGRQGWLPLALGAAATALLLNVAHGWAGEVALLAAAPLLLALRRASVRAAFYAGLCCGALEAAVLSGLVHASPLLWLAAAAFFALARALWAVGATALGAGRGALAAAGAAGAWAVVERLQAAVPGSLPTLLGDTQHRTPLAALARLGGTYLVSAMLVWHGAALARGWARWRAGRPRPWAPLLPVWAAMSVLWAVARALAPLPLPATAPVRVPDLVRVPAPVRAPEPERVPASERAARPAQASGVGPRRTASVAVVQAGLPISAYLAAQAQRTGAVPLAAYLALSRAAPGADLTIWPETAVWRPFGADAAYTAALRALAAERGALLVGTPRALPGGRRANAAVLLVPGQPDAWTAKARLAARIEAGFVPGGAPALLPWRGHALGVVFCLESAVPEPGRRLAAVGADALVVLAEGGRFGASAVGRLHAQRSVLRAIEAGRALVHAGQQGYSTVIDAAGRRRAPLGRGVAGVLHAELPLYGTRRTPFVWLGEAALAPAAAVMLAAAWRRRGLGRRPQAQRASAA